MLKISRVPSKNHSCSLYYAKLWCLHALTLPNNAGNFNKLQVSEMRGKGKRPFCSTWSKLKWLHESRKMLEPSVIKLKTVLILAISECKQLSSLILAWLCIFFIITICRIPWFLSILHLCELFYYFFKETNVEITVQSKRMNKKQAVSFKLRREEQKPLQSNIIHLRGPHDPMYSPRKSVRSRNCLVRAYRPFYLQGRRV